MGLLAFRALARQQGQHTGTAREQAAGPAGLPDAVTKAVQGPHQIRHFPALGLHQKLMLRVLGEGDMLYSGQYGGFELQELDSAVRAIEAMPNVEVGGVCSFPCFLYDEAAQDILPMPNLRTVQTAAEMLRARGYRDLMLNTPSATCTHSIPMIAAAGVSILITAFWNDAVSFMSTKWDSIVIFVVAVWLLKKKNWNPILVMVLSGFAKLAVQGVLALVGIV